MAAIHVITLCSASFFAGCAYTLYLINREFSRCGGN